jgi:hypothetical protein
MPPSLGANKCYLPELSILDFLHIYISCSSKRDRDILRNLYLRINDNTERWEKYEAAFSKVSAIFIIKT